jgi:Rrf2 family protein
MFRITRKADYAVFILSFLARRAAQANSDGLVSAQELASFSSLNKSLVANLLKDLNRAGFLTSVRGARGGYRLAKPAETINLAGILEAVEGPFTFVECAGHAVCDPGESDALEGQPRSQENRAAWDGEEALADRSGDGREASGAAAAGRGAASGTAASGATGGGPDAESSDHNCNLTSLCTSQGALLLLHRRIRGLLEEITLPELAGIDAERMKDIAQELFAPRRTFLRGGLRDGSSRVDATAESAYRTEQAGDGDYRRAHPD